MKTKNQNSHPSDSLDGPQINERLLRKFGFELKGDTWYLDICPELQFDDGDFPNYEPFIEQVIEFGIKLGENNVRNEIKEVLKIK